MERNKLANRAHSSLRFAQKVDLALATAEGGQKLYNTSKEFWRKRFAYTIVVSERDPLYSAVYDWLIAALPDEKHRALTVSSSKGIGTDTMEVSDTDSTVKEVKPLVVRFNENTSRTLVVDGCSVGISLKNPEAPTSQYRAPDPARIEFVAKTYVAQQAVLRQLDKLNAEQATSRKANLKMVGQWGSWRTRSDLPPRTMASVSLPNEQKERISNDLKTFLTAEEQYNRLAIPWHRGYMFYGPPGTGKTSLVKALANEFNLDLWYISLSDLKAESSLLGLLADVGPRSLLLLEDIDTMRITHDRDGSEQGTISMSSLLNTLDGVATPHGLITVMTTNRFDVLDPALTRAGRMDMVEKLDYPSMSTIKAMFRHFYGPEANFSIEGSSIQREDVRIEGLSTAQIAEIMKRNMGDPPCALTAIQEELDTKLDLLNS